MNSSTSNSDLHRYYVQRLCALALIPFCGLFSLAVYLEPLWGDLTRIGSYAEREFGWNRTQLEFPKPLSTLGRYDRYHDVVVLGDSFSTGRPNLHWQNYLVTATSWSVVTLDINNIAVNQVLANRVFRETPPKFVIVESAERALTGRIEDEPPCAATALPQLGGKGPLRPAAITPPRRQGPIEGTAKHVERKTAWSDIQPTYVLSYLQNSFLRIVVGDAHTSAAKVELSRSAPFSSANNHAMLVYKDDFRKVQWWREMGVREIGCRVERMRSQVEANGITRFVFMVAPDKLTTYADFLKDEGLRGISSLAELSAHHAEVMPRLDLALISAIRQGEQDVYLPNDTHWGSSGYRIATETLLQFLAMP